MTKHTPIPWRLELYGAHPDDAIAGQINGPKNKHIADIPNYGQDSGIRKEGEMVANAYLLTAAPQLLAACKAAIEATGGSANWQGETKRFLELCEAAVAAAEQS